MRGEDVQITAIYRDIEERMERDRPALNIHSVPTHTTVQLMLLSKKAFVEHMKRWSREAEECAGIVDASVSNDA